MKKLFCILLSFMIALTITPSWAYAFDETDSDNGQPAAEVFGDEESDQEDELNIDDIDEDDTDVDDTDVDDTDVDDSDEDDTDVDDTDVDDTDVDDTDEDDVDTEDDGVDEFSEDGKIQVFYDEDDPGDDTHFRNGVLTASFKLDGHSIYYIGASVFNSRTFDDLSDEVYVKNGEETKAFSDEPGWGQVWNSAELGQEGEIINVSLEKLTGPSKKGFYYIAIFKYDDYARTSDFPSSLTMKLNEINDNADPTDFGESPANYYRAEYAIEDESIADLRTTYNSASTGLEITAKKVGTTVITATLPGGRQYKCDLTVTAALLYEKKTIHIKENFANELQGVEGDITWASSNKAIATVTQDGVIRGVKKGTATITATYDGSPFKCVVTVKNPEMTKSAITPIVGQKYVLGVQGGSGKIKWATSDKSIAVVSSAGKVTAKKAGKCTITATRNGFKTTCKVTVVKKMTLNSTSVDLLLGADGTDETYKLSVTGGVGDINWTSADDEIASVDNKGNITPISKGKTTITATRDGRTLKCTVNVEEWDNVVYAPNTQWSSIDVPDADEDGWWIKIRPKQTGYIRVRVNDGSTTVHLESKSRSVSEESDLYDGDYIYYGVKAGLYYYLVFDSDDYYDDDYDDYDYDDYDDDYDWDDDDYDYDDDEYYTPYSSSPVVSSSGHSASPIAPNSSKDSASSTKKVEATAPSAPAAYDDEDYDDYDDDEDYDDEDDDDYSCNISITNTKVVNKCGYSKNGAKTIKKATAVKGVIYAGDGRAHWYKFKLTKASRIKVYLNSKVDPSVSLTIYQGSKVVSRGGQWWFDYDEYDTLTSGTQKMKAGTYYLRVRPDPDSDCTGFYSIKWW